MGETRKQLMDILSSLNPEDKAWVINMLVQQLAGTSESSKKARKLHHDDFTPEQWEEYFNGEAPVAFCDEHISHKDILPSTTGKSVKPLLKWL